MKRIGRDRRQYTPSSASATMSVNKGELGKVPRSLQGKVA